MTAARSAAATAAAFVVSQILAVIIHGFLLAADYAPFYGTLLRPMSNEGAWQMMLLPVVHLCWVAGLVWVYRRIHLGGSALAQGVQLGLLGWVMGQLPRWLLWYAQQPWPGSLVVKQIVLELLASLVVGATIAAVARSRSRVTLANERSSA